MSNLNNSATVAFNHYILRRIDEELNNQEVVRFGEREKVGAAIVAMVVDDAK